MIAAANYLEGKKKQILDVKNGLFDVCIKLHQSADVLNNAVIKQLVREELDRLDLGLIRVAFVGQTNSGKSTVINALYETILFPERMITSTAIPSWVGYTDRDNNNVTVYKTNGSEDSHSADEMDLVEFRKKLCFKLSDQSDEKRKGFESYKWAKLKRNNKLGEYGIVTVDTLGTQATEFDTLTTLKAIQKADILVYIINGSTGNLGTSEIDFLRKYILRYDKCPEVPESEYLKPLIPPERIIFAINKIDLATAPSETIEAIRKKMVSVIKVDGSYDNTLYQKMLGNVVAVSGLSARLAKVGIYPYREEFPKDTETDRRTIEEYIDFEETKLFMAERKNRDLYADSNISALVNKIHEIVELTYQGENSAFSKRIFDLRKQAADIMNDIDARRALAKAGEEEFNNLIQEIRRIEDRVRKEKDETVKKISEEYPEEMAKSINNLLAKILNDKATFVEEIGAYLGQELGENMPLPEDFPDNATFKKMEQYKKEELFSRYFDDKIMEILKEIAGRMAEKVLTASSGTSVDGFHSPYEISNDILTYAKNKASLINQKINNLSELDISGVKIYVPDEAYFTAVLERISLETKLSTEETFQTLATTSFWKQSLATMISNIKVGFFQKLSVLFNSDSIREKIWQQYKVAMGYGIIQTIAVAAGGAVPFRIDSARITKIFSKLASEFDVTYVRILDTLGQAITDKSNDFDGFRKEVEKNEKLWDTILEDMGTIIKTLNFYKNSF